MRGKAAASANPRPAETDARPPSRGSPRDQDPATRSNHTPQLMAAAPNCDRLGELMNVGIVIPAYEAASVLGGVLTPLRGALATRENPVRLLVVDDGSTDTTATVAEQAGAEVIRHQTNQGKGAALSTGLRWASEQGLLAIVTADADGQHPTCAILQLLDASAPLTTLVLGVRDLKASCAPRSHHFSNGISNRFLSWFTGLSLRDTQCGLRRYPVSATLKLGVRATGYAFEAEIILRAARAGMDIAQLRTKVYYPPAHQRLSHFDKVRDPARIIGSVLRTVLEP